MSGPPWVVAHLSDLHIGRPNSTIEAVVGPTERLRTAVERLNGLIGGRREQWLVVVTGDLVDTGVAEEYAILAEVLAPLDCRSVLLPGNHDVPALLAEAFPTHVEAQRGGGEPGFSVDDFPLRIVGLDTILEGRHDGGVDGDRVAWLDRTLSARPDHPTLVGLHHPPVLTGMWWMDYGGIEGVDALGRVVSAHPQVERVLCGHVHRSGEARWAGTVVSMGAALAHQSAPALAGDSVPWITDEEPTIGLHLFDGTGVLTQRVSLRVPGMGVDLREVITPWEPYERAARAGGPMPSHLAG